MDKLGSYKEYKASFESKKLVESDSRISRQLQKATEEYHESQLELQKIQKEFVSTPKEETAKRNELKTKLIKQNEVVKQKEKLFHKALGNEDIEDLEI
jgi:hypothetical protein